MGRPSAASRCFPRKPTEVQEGPGLSGPLPDGTCRLPGGRTGGPSVRAAEEKSFCSVRGEGVAESGEAAVKPSRHLLNQTQNLGQLKHLWSKNAA